MIEAQAGVSAAKLSDDVVQPFHLGALSRGGPRISGRLVRLGALVNTTLHRHAYPEPLAHLLAEALALTAALAASLKFEGIFSMQTRSDGPVSLLVADVTSAGKMRGYAQFDDQALARVSTDTETPSFTDLMGGGHLAFTVDQTPKAERYQGIVELTGHNLADCARHYFRQSQQLDSALILAAGRPTKARWRAGALVLQRLLQAHTLASDDTEDPWRQAMILMATDPVAEMLDHRLDPNQLLYRLFNQLGVRVTSPRKLAQGCRCSRARAARVLRGIPRTELDDLRIDGRVVVTCQFCSATHTFDQEQLDAAFGP